MFLGCDMCRKLDSVDQHVFDAARCQPTWNGHHSQHWLQLVGDVAPEWQGMVSAIPGTSSAASSSQTGENHLFSISWKSYNYDVRLKRREDCQAIRMARRPMASFLVMTNDIWTLKDSYNQNQRATVEKKRYFFTK